MENLKIFCRSLSIFCLTLLWVFALSFVASPMAIAAEDYEYYQPVECEKSNTTNSHPTPAVMLIGGGEVGAEGGKKATQWFLDKADKGDYLVIRFGRIGRQAKWICDNFPDAIHSAAELSINTRRGANSQEVENHIKDAEALFIAGGQQDNYVKTWKGTSTEDAINYLINEKKVPIAGTSAGMSILGEYYYSPRGKGLVSSEILNNPFHPNVDDINRGDFIDLPILKDTITDSHLDRLHPPRYKETRYGRIFGFLARLVDDNSLPSYAIGAENGAFIAIDTNGIATVFGNGTNRGADAYFLRAETRPENLREDEPLVWDSDGKAVKVYKIQGTTEGSGQFNLKDWKGAEGGEWGYWYTRYGIAGFHHCP
ncbi:MAG: Type 1 glutamine amidotransferase-like domain-containing protein [Crocosphaera sp.]|nr:Type 1 glutamine amidotransferase-like domain-containing protein [Crocosphaera sp.]